MVTVGLPALPEDRSLYQVYQEFTNCFEAFIAALSVADSETSLYIEPAVVSLLALDFEYPVYQYLESPQAEEIVDVAWE
jgi:hypothetical protein